MLASPHPPATASRSGATSPQVGKLGRRRGGPVLGAGVRRLEGLPPAYCWAGDSTEKDVGYDMLCPGAFIPLYMGSVKPLQVFAANSDLGGQLGVLLFVDQVLQFPWIFHVDAQQPAGAIWLGVDDVRVFERFGIDLDDLAADGRLDRRRRFLGFHVPHAPPCLKHLPEIGERDACDLT